jgi:quinolinate synthase
MFRLALEAQSRGMGVVGSTSNILDFVAGKLADALAADYAQRLTFVLGTEAGMITAIVRKVQALLSAAGRADVDVEVVFPVNPSAIATPQQQVSAASGVQPAVPADLGLGGLRVLPGPAAGEGCSLEGGCASCPYMKMNSLAALVSVAERVGEPAGEATLEAFRPKAYAEQIQGMSMAQAGCVPILHMRHFGKHKALSDALVQDVVSRNQ